MNPSALENLKNSIALTKASIESLNNSLRRLSESNLTLAHEKKIEFDTYMDINQITSRIHGLLKNKPIDKLDEIVAASDVVSIAPFYVLNEAIRNKEWIDILELLRGLGFNLNTLFEKPLPSVKVGTDLNPENRSKPIDNLLYSYTPFRLRGAAGDYTMLLVPSTRRHNIERGWSDDNAITFYEGTHKILTPNSVRLVKFDDLRNPISVEGEQFFKLELDRRSPTNTYFCRMGLYVSPSSTCTRRDCHLWEPCKGRRFWKGPRSFYSIAKVSPQLSTKVERYDKPRTLQTSNLGISIEIIDSLLAKRYIQSVSFLSSQFAHTPMINLKESPGYMVTTKAISFSIDGEWLEKFVERVLSQDNDIFAWIYTKYYILENFDVNDMRRVTDFLWNLINDTQDQNVRNYDQGIKRHDVTKELVHFGVRLLIHSLAHKIFEEVVSDLQTSPNNLFYSYREGREPDGKYRIFVIENAEKGLGLTESFATIVSKTGVEYMRDLADSLNNIFAIDGRDALATAERSERNDDVNTIWNRANQYNQTLQMRYGISLPVEYLRYILSSHDQTVSAIIDRNDIAPFIDDILSASPLCWDGCYHCVRLESGCHDSPYGQMFSVSKSLSLAFVNEWLSSIGHLTTDESPSAVVQIGAAKNLLDLIKNAKNSVVIISPWFSKEVAKQIADLKPKLITFRILTSLDDSNDTHIRALDIFKTAIDKNLQVKAFVDRFPHLKMIIIDESLLIIGSANMTLSGLYGNIEGYVILRKISEARRALARFNELWKEAIDLDR